MSTDGIAAAVADAAGPDHRALGFMPDAVQLNLLRGEEGRIDASGLRQIRTGPGRRPGSRNKRNAKTAQLIVQRYGDPLDALGNFAAMPVEDAVAMLRHADNPDGDDELDRICDAVSRLASRLEDGPANELSKALVRYMSRKQISALDVAAMQVRVQQDLMTYVHGRQPVSVEVREKTDAVIIIPGINAPRDVDQQTLADAIDARGLDAIDFDTMTLLPAPVDAEFSELRADDDDD